MAAAGVRTPAMALITDAQAFRHDLLGVPLPLFVREDWGHGGLMLEAQTLQQARSIALERFKRPVAVQKIDTSDAQGVFRRYRYFAASDAGISQNVHWSTDWVTRADGRIETEEAQAGERAYTGAPNPHHALFQAARRALGLDMVAIDYGLLPDGQPVLWEANPFPVVAFLHRVPEYRNLAMHRMVAAILRMYLQAVGLAVPPEIEDFVQYRSDGAALLEAGWKRGLGTAR